MPGDIFQRHQTCLNIFACYIGILLIYLKLTWGRHFKYMIGVKGLILAIFFTRFYWSHNLWMHPIMELTNHESHKLQIKSSCDTEAKVFCSYSTNYHVFKIFSSCNFMSNLNLWKVRSKLKIKILSRRITFNILCKCLLFLLYFSILLLI